MAPIIDANECTLSLFLTPDTYPTVASVKTTRYEWETLDQSPFSGGYVQYEDLILGGVIDEIWFLDANVVL